MVKAVQAALDTHGIDDTIEVVGQFEPRGSTGSLFAGGMIGSEVGGAFGEVGDGSRSGGGGDRRVVPRTRSREACRRRCSSARPSRRSTASRCDGGRRKEPHDLVFRVPRDDLTVKVHARVNVRVLELINPETGIEGRARRQPPPDHALARPHQVSRRRARPSTPPTPRPRPKAKCCQRERPAVILVEGESDRARARNARGAPGARSGRGGNRGRGDERRDEHPRLPARVRASSCRRTVRCRRSRTSSGARSERTDLEARGFFVCDADLEDELIRALGTARVEQIIAAEGELASLRTLQKQPAQRDRTLEQHLHRFMGVRSTRKYRYARLLVEALNPTRCRARLLRGARSRGSVQDGSPDGVEGVAAVVERGAQLRDGFTERARTFEVLADDLHVGRAVGVEPALDRLRREQAIRERAHEQAAAGGGRARLRGTPRSGG